MMQQRALELYAREFGAAAQAVRSAPGRVNLIGDHTDYNDGFVLPMVINRAVWLAFTPRDDGQVRLYSADLERWGSFDLAEVARPRERGDAVDADAGWLEYVKGTAWALQGAGHALRGLQGVLLGDVPIGAGLSSSAAVEVASARALLAAAALDVAPVPLALLAQRAECDWVGTRCGIMDQLISSAGRDGEALLIDCRSLDCERVPVPRDAAVFVLDTGTRRGLVGSQYNQRREQCERAARVLGVPALRDADLATLSERAGALSTEELRRARHVISENARTTAAAAALRGGDLAAVGRLMDQSHASLRDDFEVSTVALDAIAAAARAQPGCFGARMTGAGFGGCAVALVDTAAAAPFPAAVAERYHAATGERATVYLCSPSPATPAAPR